MKIAIASSNDTDLDMLSPLIHSKSDHKIIWTASNEADLMDSYKKNSPDMLLLDIAFSKKPSDCARDIMNTSPCVILLMTAAVAGNEATIFEAMRWGALDVATIPTSLNEKNSCAEFMHKIEIMSTLADSKETTKSPKKRKPASLVVIGASTGGPNAIRTILADFPADFQGHIVIVQHIDAEFLPGLASWLNDQIALDVNVARDGDKLKKGKVLIAQGPDDLTITKKKTLKYVKPLPGSVFNPSIDVFFTSCVNNLTEQGIAVILSGMGKDGSKGMKAMSKAGWETIAQDKATSAIYGMPKEAAATGGAKHILAVQDIAKSILKRTQNENE